MEALPFFGVVMHDTPRVTKVPERLSDIEKHRFLCWENAIAVQTLLWS